MTKSALIFAMNEVVAGGSGSGVIVGGAGVGGLEGRFQATSGGLGAGD